MKSLEKSIATFSRILRLTGECATPNVIMVIFRTLQSCGCGSR